MDILKKLILTKDETLKIGNFTAGNNGTLFVEQDEVGGHILNLPSDLKYRGSITLNTEPNGISLIKYVVDDEGALFSVSYPLAASGSTSGGGSYYDKTQSDARYYPKFDNPNGYLTNVSWPEISGKPTFFDGNYYSLANHPTNLSQFYNDLSDAWLTKLEADTFYQPLENQRLSTFNDVIFNSISSTGYTSGALGSGWKIDTDGNIEVDSLTVRKDFNVSTLNIREITGTGGAFAVTNTLLVSEVVDGGVAWVIRFDNEDGSIGQNFRAYDIIRCQVWDGTGLKYYTGVVSTIGDDYLYVHKDSLTGTGIPEKGDKIFQFGNTLDSDRQGLLYLTNSDTGAPYLDVLDDIDSDDLAGKTKVRLGKLDGLTSPIWGGLSGYGLYGQNAILENAFISGAINITGGNASTKDYADSSAANAQQNAIDTAAQDASEKVNNISIGGRNLLKASGDVHENSSYPTATYPITETIADGELVTITIWGELGAGKINWTLYNSGGSIPITEINASHEVEPNKYVKTFNWVVGDSFNGVLYLYPFDYGVSAISLITKIKLEKGNKGTDYSPAPEDIEEALANAETTLKDYSDSQIAISAAATLLTASSTSYNQAETARQAAEAASATYAQTVANSAASLAEINAAADADAKASAAYTNAVATAEAARQALADSLGAMAFDDLVQLSKLGNTIIEGGFIKTTLLDVDVLRASIVNASQIIIDGGGATLAQLDAAKAEAKLNDKIVPIADGKIFNNVFSISDSPVNAALVIHTNIKYTGNYMNDIRIKGYNYVIGAGDIDLTISFYSYDVSSLFHSYGFTSKGSYVIDKVRLAYNASTNAVSIIIGDDMQAWSYPKLTVEKWTATYQIPPDSLGDGWTGSFTSDFTGLSDILEIPATILESTLGSQTKATNALNSAVSQATTLANTAQSAAETYAANQAAYEREVAKAHADGLVSAEEAARIAEALANLNESKSYADSTAEAARDAAISSANATAESIAQSKANIAETNAIASAASDAETKAENARIAAEAASAAYSDIVSNSAASAAEAAAAADASTKATQARIDAEATAAAAQTALTNSLKSLAYTELDQLEGITTIDKGGVTTIKLDAAYVKANVVNAGYINTLALDASVITSGLISANRIDVDNLVATNLAANQGTIGPLNIESESLYLGNENFWEPNSNFVKIAPYISINQVNGATNPEMRKVAFNQNFAPYPEDVAAYTIISSFYNTTNYALIVDAKNATNNIGVLVRNGDVDVKNGDINVEDNVYVKGNINVNTNLTISGNTSINTLSAKYKYIDISSNAYTISAADNVVIIQFSGTGSFAKKVLFNYLSATDGQLIKIINDTPNSVILERVHSTVNFRKGGVNSTSYTLNSGSSVDFLYNENTRNYHFI